MTVDVRIYARQYSSTAGPTAPNDISQQALRRGFSAGDQKASDCQHVGGSRELITDDVDEQKGNLLNAEVNTDEEELPTKSSCANGDKYSSECASTSHQTDKDEREEDNHGEEKEDDRELVKENRSLAEQDRKLTKIRFCSSAWMFV